MPHSGNVTFTYVEGDDVEVEKMNGREMSQKKDGGKKEKKGDVRFLTLAMSRFSMSKVLA